MRPSSEAFAETITGAHSLAIKVEAGFPGSEWVEVPISDGSVGMDRTNPVRRTLDLTIPGREWISTDPQHPLSPFGGHITARRGIRYPNGDKELIPLTGPMLIQAAPVDHFVGHVTIKAHDLFQALVDDRFEAPFTPPKNKSTVDVIRGLIADTLPDAVVTVDLRVDDTRYPKGTVFEEDRAGAIIDIAKGLGCEIFANTHGGFTLRPIPTIDDPPVATLTSGPGGVLISAQGERTREGVYNTVVARSEPTDPEEESVSATVRDESPLSPTRYDGPFGRKPKFYSSPMFTTEEQAAKAARSMLADSIGSSRDANLDAVPDPRLEAGDVITLAYGQLEENHILDTLTIPLTTDGAWTATTRSATSASEEALR